MKKNIGYIFVGIASLLWIVCIVVPFLSFSFGVKAAIIGTAVVLAEVFFWIGALFIGKNIWQVLKEKRQAKRDRGE